MKVGYSLPSIGKKMVQENVNTYAIASGDHNPLHWDPDFAKNATHYGRIVAHGMLVLAYISEMMTKEFGIDWVGSGRLKVRFRSPVYPGDRVETFGQVVKLEKENLGLRVHCSVGCRKYDGEEVIHGQASLLISYKEAGVI